MAEIVLKTCGRVLEITTNVGSAFASRRPEADLSSLP